MSLWMFIPYVEHQINIGKMTREEGESLLNDIAEIDRKQDEFDREVFEKLQKDTIWGGIYEKIENAKDKSGF